MDPAVNDGEFESKQGPKSQGQQSYDNPEFHDSLVLTGKLHRRIIHSTVRRRGDTVLEPTGPVMGPNAAADVMPLGGRQEPW